MIDLFLLLTPLLLLGVVALLGFAGCTFHPGMAATITIDPVSGPTTGGTLVTISDSAGAFASNSNAAVTFGTAAPVAGTFVRSTDITALTPAQAAGTVDVVVNYTDSANHSQTFTLTGAFTYDTVTVPLSFVQTASIEQAIAPPIQVTLNNTSPGNLLVAAVTYTGAGVTATVSDNLGNTFTQAGSATWLRNASIFYLPNIPGGNVTIKAVGTAGANGPCSMSVSEYSGADLTSAAVYGFSTARSLNAGTAGVEPVQGVAVSPAQSADIVYLAVFASRDTTLSAGSGFSLHPSTTASLLVEDSASAVTAAQTVATVDTTGGNFAPWVVLAVAIKA